MHDQLVDALDLAVRALRTEEGRETAPAAERLHEALCEATEALEGLLERLGRPLDLTHQPERP